VQIVTATAATDRPGPLLEVVNAFTAAQGEVLAAGVSQPSDWDPVARFVSPDFKRVGAYLEELDWEAYKAFLTGWAKGGTRFEFTVFHITEVGDAVFQEIEERHHRGDEFIRKNVIAVYRFDQQRRIRHLDIYEQATDSGRWIADAAKAATAG
jgi:limonene-1,2-epoxide hydrolase